MSNPQHPRFADATIVGPGMLAGAVPASFNEGAGTEMPRTASARTWSVGASLSGLGLWGFLLVELSSNLATPTIF